MISASGKDTKGASGRLANARSRSSLSNGVRPGKMEVAAEERSRGLRERARSGPQQEAEP